MNRFVLSLVTLLVLMSNGECFGQPTPAKMGSTLKPSSTIPEREFLEKPGQVTPPKPTKPTPLPTPIKPPPQVPQHAEYLHPGILVYLNGRWEGSDHLLNLPNSIGVYVTIVKPEEEALNITAEQLQKEVEMIFGQANLKPLTLAAQGRPPLPAFEIEIFLYPIEKGYAACCDGRLFESVTLDRFKMDPNMAFQAITWEKQTLIVGPKATFAEQLLQNVQGIAVAFIDRYLTYERLKGQMH
jgi:hypothetical protein